MNGKHGWQVVVLAASLDEDSIREAKEVALRIENELAEELAAQVAARKQRRSE